MSSGRGPGSCSTEGVPEGVRVRRQERHDLSPRITERYFKTTWLKGDSRRSTAVLQLVGRIHRCRHDGLVRNECPFGTCLQWTVGLPFRRSQAKKSVEMKVGSLFIDAAAPSGKGRSSTWYTIFDSRKFQPCCSVERFDLSWCRASSETGPGSAARHRHRRVRDDGSAARTNVFIGTSWLRRTRFGEPAVAAWASGSSTVMASWRHLGVQASVTAAVRPDFDRAAENDNGSIWIGSRPVEAWPHAGRRRALYSGLDPTEFFKGMTRPERSSINMVRKTLIRSSPLFAV